MKGDENSANIIVYFITKYKFLTEKINKIPDADMLLFSKKAIKKIGHDDFWGLPHRAGLSSGGQRDWGAGGLVKRGWRA